MQTNFYMGNYSLVLGQPFVIISTETRGEEFISEKIIIFNAFNGEVTLKGYKSKQKQFANNTLEEFIASEVQSSKDQIYFDILNTKYQTQLKNINFNAVIELVETNSSIIGFIRDKFPAQLEVIKSKTENQPLKSLIKIYQSIVVERNDFDLD